MRRIVVLSLVLLVSGCSALKPRRVAESETIYTVAKGDSLEKIARRSGLSIGELVSYNGLSKPSSLRVGQIIKIPAVGPLSSDPSPSNFKGDENTRMVSISHVRPYVGRLAFPVHGSRFTSSFGYRWGRFHEGTDFAAPEGTPVYAAHDGVVVFTSEAHGKYGKILVVKGEGLLTVYGHNSRNIARVGGRISKGDHIADVGETGKASGPHLHFETRVRDASGRYVAVDPYIFFVQLNPS